MKKSRKRKKNSRTSEKELLEHFEKFSAYLRSLKVSQEDEKKA